MSIHINHKWVDLSKKIKLLNCKIEKESHDVKNLGAQIENIAKWQRDKRLPQFIIDGLKNDIEELNSEICDIIKRKNTQEISINEYKLLIELLRKLKAMRDRVDFFENKNVIFSLDCDKELHQYWKSVLEKRYIVNKLNEEIENLKLTNNDLLKEIDTSSIKNKELQNQVRIIREELMRGIQKNLDNKSQAIDTYKEKSMEKTLKQYQEAVLEMHECMNGIKNQNARHVKMISMLQDQIRFWEKKSEEDTELINSIKAFGDYQNHQIQLQRLDSHQLMNKLKRDIKELQVICHQNNQILDELESRSINMSQEEKHRVENYTNTLFLHKDTEANSENNNEEPSAEPSTKPSAKKPSVDHDSETPEKSEIKSECSKCMILHNTAKYRNDMILEVILDTIHKWEKTTKMLISSRSSLSKVLEEVERLKYEYHCLFSLKNKSKINKMTSTNASKVYAYYKPIQDQITRAILDIKNNEIKLLHQSFKHLLSNSACVLNFYKIGAFKDKELFSSFICEASEKIYL